MLRYRRRYYGTTIPRPVLIAGAAAVVVGATGVTAHHHHHGHHAGTPAGGSNLTLGQNMAAAYGWTAGNGQWQCLDTLWTGESGWSQYSDTRASGLDAPGAAVFAYGIPQARGHGAQAGGVTAPYPPAYAAANPASLGGSSDPKTQIRWGLGYIQATYTNPCNALAFKRANGNQGY